VGTSASKPSNFYVYLGRGLDLMRPKHSLEFWRAARVGECDVRLQDLDMIKRVAILISAARTKAFDTMAMQVIDEAETIHKLILTPQSPPSATPALCGILIGEVHRVFDETVEADERVPDIDARKAAFAHLAEPLDAPTAEPSTRPNVTIWQLLDQQLETSIVEATLCLDLLPEYSREVARRIGRGQIGMNVGRPFVKGVEAQAVQGMDVAEQEAVVSRARLALTGDAGAADREDSDETLVGIIPLVDELLKRIPERFQACTTGKVSPLRKTMKELMELRRRHPTSPEQLGYLAMIFVRLDGVDDYDELLEQVRSLERHAVGEVQWRRPGWRFPQRSPGLLRLADEGDFDEEALALAEEISGKSRQVLLEPRIILQGD
jgi:hypothetical protein